VIHGLRLALLLAGAASAGRLLLSPLSLWLPPRAGSRVLHVSLALLFGLGATSLLGVVLLLACGPSSTAFLLKDLALVCAAGVQELRRRPASAAPRDPANETNGGRITAVLGGLALAVAAVDWMRQAIRYLPDGGWDAWAIWNYRARLFLRLGGQWKEAFSPLRFHSHPDYPLLLPSLVLQGWTSAGSESPRVPLWIAALFTLLLVSILLSAVRVFTSRAMTFCAGALLLAPPAFVQLTSNQYADLEVAAFALAGAVLLVLALEQAHPPFPPLALAGLAFSFAASTKNEGLLHLGAFGGALVLTSVWATRAWRFRGPLYFSAGAAPCLLLLQAFKRLTPTNDLLEHATLGVLVDRLARLGRWQSVAHGLKAVWRPYGPFGPLLIAVAALGVLALIRPGRISREARLVGLATLGVQSGFVFVFLTTPQDILWHIQTSADRLLLQGWPCAILFIGLCFNAGLLSLLASGIRGISISSLHREQSMGAVKPGSDSTLPGTLAILIIALAILAAVVWMGVLGHLPLTFDEAYNYEQLSRHGVLFVVTHYIAPNNHRLFTMLQTTLPDAWIARVPTLLRLWNIALCVVIMSLLVPMLLRAGWSRSWTAFWLAAILFCAPAFTLYLFIIRGYLLGFTLVLSAAVIGALFSSPAGLVAMSVVAGLATATVPTFLLAFPGLMLVSFVRLWRLRGARTAILSAALGSVLHLTAGLGLYLRDMGEVRNNTHAIQEAATWRTFLEQTSLLGNTAWISAAYFLLLAGALWVALRRSSSTEKPDGHRKTEDRSADGTSRLLAFHLLGACASYVCVFTPAIAAHLTDCPFTRQGLFVAPFVSISIALLLARQSPRVRWGAGAVVAMNLVLGATLAWSAGVRPGDPNRYPYLHDLLPTPAAGAAQLIRRVGPIDALESTPIWGSTEAEPYESVFHVPQVPLADTSTLECAVGRFRPVPGQEVVAVKDHHRYLLCF